MTQIFGLLLVLWITIFGFSMILGQHRVFARWTGQVLRRTGRYLLRQLAALWRWVWRRYHQAIVGFAAGFLLALYVVGYFR